MERGTAVRDTDFSEPDESVYNYFTLPKYSGNIAQYLAEMKFHRFCWGLCFFMMSAHLFAQIRSTNSLVPTSSNSANALSFQIRSINELGTFFTTSDPDSSFYLAKLAVDRAVATGDPMQVGLAKRRMGELFYLQGVYDYSMAYLSEALEEFRDLGQQNEIANTMLSIGAAYQFHDLWSEALNGYRQALKIYRQIDDTLGLAETYGLLGHFYEKNASYDSAFFYQYRSLDIYKALDDAYGKAIIYDNIGSIHEDLQEFDKAYRYFTLSAKYDSVSGNMPALVNTLNNIGDTFRKRWIYDSAVFYTNYALRNALSHDLNYEVLSAYNDLAKLNRAFGKEELALVYYDSANEFSQALFNSQIASQIANFQTLYRTREKEQEIALLESQKQIEENTRKSILIGALGLIGFAGVFILQQRNKNKKSREFFEAEQALTEAKLKNVRLKEEALQTELENNRLREERLHAELESRSQELTTKALHIIQKNKLLRELKQQITEIQREARHKDLMKAMKRLCGLIDQGFRFDKDWDEFVSSFDQVHPEFFKKLKSTFQNLTAAELRLAALIRLNLNSKDMAAILAISQDSLRISRYRLRKKLALEKGESLSVFVSQL